MIDERPRQPIASFSEGAFSNRDRSAVDRVRAMSGSRPQTSLKPGHAQQSRSSASSYPEAIAKTGRGPCPRACPRCAAVRGDRGSTAPIFPDSGPTIRHREQHDAAIRSDSPAIKSGCDRFRPTAGSNRSRLMSVMASGRSGTRRYRWCKQPESYAKSTLPRSPASKTTPRQ